MIVGQMCELDKGKPRNPLVVFSLICDIIELAIFTQMVLVMQFKNGPWLQCTFVFVIESGHILQFNSYSIYDSVTYTNPGTRIPSFPILVYCLIFFLPCLNHLRVV